MLKRVFCDTLFRRLALYGAGDEIRTRDNLLGKQGLYQLSYSRSLGECSPKRTSKNTREFWY